MFAINFSNMLPDAKAKLAERVTTAIGNAPPYDTDDIQAAGQLLNYIMKTIPDTSLVDVNVNGGTDPSNGNRAFTISVRSHNTAPQTTPTTTPWTPDVGPLAVTNSVEAPKEP